MAVEFNTSTMQLTVGTKMEDDLPIIHRNVFLLAALNPAVVVRSTTEQATYHLWAPNQLDVGGNTTIKNDLPVDGVPQLLANKSSYSPPMFSLGAPIKKNKIFNFTAYERWLNIEPRTAFYTLPTGAERGEIFRSLAIPPAPDQKPKGKGQR